MRKSSVRNLATDVSPETQEREVRSLAARHGDNGSRLVMLADWDISGRGRYTKKRTGYLELVEAIETGRCSAVYSYSLSRLGRSSTELSRLFDLCIARNVPIRLVADVIDTSTASGRMMAGMLALIAQFEADVASERVTAMYATKRARGEDIRTSRRYGEAEGEDEQAVLDAFRETGSYSRAAKALNERGVKARQGGAWWSSSVAVVVQRLDPSIRPTGRGNRAGGAGFLLARLLSCPTCGSRLTGSNLRLPKGGTRVRYACRFAESSPHPRVTISEHLILPAIRAEADLVDVPATIEDEIVDREQRGRLETRRGRWLELYADGQIDRAELARRVAAIDEEVANLDSMRLMRAVPEVPWDKGSVRDINAVLRAQFERIDLDPVTWQPINFVWRIPRRQASEGTSTAA
jgi:DNA invertase Pin-like site-specific DNA recombinase